MDIDTATRLVVLRETRDQAFATDFGDTEKPAASPAQRQGSPVYLSSEPAPTTL